MKTRSLLLGLAALAALSGCAGLPPGPMRLRVSVVPETVHPGDVVRVHILAPAGTREVTGRLDVPGSPVLSLRSRDGGATWDFVTQIPVDAVWKPGKYRVEVRGLLPDDTSVYGETWIEAP